MLSLTPVIRAYLVWYLRNKGRIEVEALKEIWSSLVGHGLSQRTEPARLAGSRLEIRVPDAVWQQELQFQSPIILERLNSVLPESVVRVNRLRYLVDPVLKLSELPKARSVRDEPPRKLSQEQEEAANAIRDPELRTLVKRVVRGSRKDIEC